MADVKFYEVQVSPHGGALVEYDLSEPAKMREVLSRGVSLTTGPRVGGNDISLRRRGEGEYELTVTPPSGPSEAFQHTTLVGALDRVRELAKLADELEAE